jgi:hypothetical protein
MYNIYFFYFLEKSENKTIISEYDIWTKYLAYSKKRKWENFYL